MKFDNSFYKHNYKGLGGENPSIALVAWAAIVFIDLAKLTGNGIAKLS